MTDEYIAGFFDGEGCVIVRRHRGRIEVELEVTNTDRATLEAIQLHLGRGRVVPRSRLHMLGTKPVWMWRCAARDDIRAVLARIAPLLIQKRDKALAALDAANG